jgi:peptide-methionine (S)-S-oxide reductase
MLFFGRQKATMIDPEQALPGSDRPLRVPERHAVLGTPLEGPFPAGVQTAVFGLGCFWGAERIFWQAPGVYTTAVGYAGGYTPNPTYEEVCSGRTGHSEVVLVAFWADQAPAGGSDEGQTTTGGGSGVADWAAVTGGEQPTVTTTYEQMLRLFWEGHDPTQGMRQGNDVGTQYRSMILFDGDTQRNQAQASATAYQQMLTAAGHGQITTEIAPLDAFYYAEDYHQQYLAKNPNGYCGLGGTGVSCPIGLAPAG